MLHPEGSGWSRCRGNLCLDGTGPEAPGDELLGHVDLLALDAGEVGEQTPVQEWSLGVPHMSVVELLNLGPCERPPVAELLA